MIIWIYLALLATVYIHELGHFGKRIVFDSYFPIPVAHSDKAYQYGGLIANALTAFIIFMLRPEAMPLQLLGLVSWIYVITYCIWGSFNEEIDWPEWMWPFVVFDDVPNKYWWIFIPIAIALFSIFQCYYLPMVGGMLGS